MSQKAIRRRRSISRRTFCKQTVLAAGAVAATGRAVSAASDTSNPTYIDMHVHLGQPWATREPLTADVLLRWMDEHCSARTT